MHGISAHFAYLTQIKALPPLDSMIMKSAHFSTTSRQLSQLVAMVFLLAASQLTGAPSSQPAGLNHAQLEILDDKNPAELASYTLPAEKKFIALYYTAMWCPPCRATTPALVDEYQFHQSSPVEIVMVSSDRTPEQRLKYLRDYNMPFPAVAWADIPKLEKYAPNSIPHLALIEADTGKLITTSREVGIDGVVEKMRQLAEVTDAPDFSVPVSKSRWLVPLAIIGMFLALMLFRQMRGGC